jgi:16S rRNA (guanine(966)-N(2))-methyltransferase RsmD
MPVRARSDTSAAARRPNRVRIIGGVWRSRMIPFPDLPGLRPTPDRVRETLFNWLGQDLTGKCCLDLFAGSGALGFEALSRGAASVTMVERAPRAWRALQDNAALLRARDLNVVCGDALEFLAGVPASARFDVVFLDPPFGEGVPEGLWLRLLERLSDQGLVYLECDAMFAGHPRLEMLKHGHAGAVHYHLLGRKRDDQGGISGNV